MKEFLEESELVAMAGAKEGSKDARKQIEWLASRGWVFEVSASNRPVVGRVYTRLKLAGVSPSTVSAEPWTLDLSGVEWHEAEGQTKSGVAAQDDQTNTPTQVREDLGRLLQ